MKQLTVTPQRIATDQDVTLTFTAYDSGTQTDIGTLTLGIVDGNGDTVVSSGTAMTSDGADGTYTYDLSAVSDVDHLTVTVTESGGDVFTVFVEAVGGFLFGENQARNWGVKDDSTNKPLTSDNEYSDARIADERDRITDDLERWTGRSWVPRYCRIEAPGTGSGTLYVGDGIPRTAAGRRLDRPGRHRDIVKLLSVTVDGTTVSTADVQVDQDTGTLIRDSGTWNAPNQSDVFNVVVEYEYGMPHLVDGVDRIALDLLVDRLVPSRIPQSATSWDTEFGTVRLVTEGGRLRNVSRLPHVNQWVRDHAPLPFT